MIYIVVGVEKRLNNLKVALSAKGYEVVDLENYNYPLDAIIYESSIPQMSYISTNNMPSAYMGKRNNYGVFLLNSKGRSIDELDSMLRKRCYSPLF